MSKDVGQDPEAGRRLADVESAIEGSEFDRAARLAAEAVDGGMRHPLLFSVMAFQREREGDLEEALKLLGLAFEMTPTDPHILQGIGVCLSKQSRWPEAIAAFDAALAASPGFAAALHHKGAVLEIMGRNVEAGRYYELAIASNGGYADPLGGRASIAARDGDHALARDFGRRALAIEPYHTNAHIALAAADTADGRFDAAAARLRSVLSGPEVDPTNRAAVFAKLGDTLDAQGRFAAAFEAYAEGKRLSRDRFAASPIADDARANLVRIADIKGYVAGLRVWPAPSMRSAASRGPRIHAFLVGFPRSGTTLLEQVLASHPDGVTLDERPCLNEADAAFMLSAETLKRLIAASDADLDPYRDSYWRQVAGYGLHVDGKIFLDKFPLSSVLLPVIERLFPNAKILFAERDPRDVVLSCFRRSFQMNHGMYQFTTLEGSARFYDDVMALIQVYREKIPMDLHVIRYERLVADFEGECRRMCAFLGMEWHEAMKDFAATAKARAITTPSAAQVRKGLYAEGAGHWRRYADSLAPILPILAPWVEAMGYEAS